MAIVYCVLRVRLQSDVTTGMLRTFLVVVDLSAMADYTPKIDAVLTQVSNDCYRITMCVVVLSLGI